MDSIPELKILRSIVCDGVRDAMAGGSDEDVIAFADCLSYVDTEILQRELQNISQHDRRWLHLGGDPAQVYQGTALELYLEMQAKEKADANL